MEPILRNGALTRRYTYFTLPPPGDVIWVDRQTAFSQGLVYNNAAGNAIIKVDNTTNVPWNDKRNSVSTLLLSASDGAFVLLICSGPGKDHDTRRLRSREPLDRGHGSYAIWVFGTYPSILSQIERRTTHAYTQVWPAFWAKGPTWPYDGEIE